MLPIYLASASPRRQFLLEQLRLPFSLLACPIKEELTGAGMSPGVLVEFLAEKKAKAAAQKIEKGIVIGADTVVFCRGRALGKPADAAEAEKILRFLQGREHLVFTGLALVKKPLLKVVVAHERTKVKFRSLTKEQVKCYVATGEPLDKAGAYAIQGLGAVLVKKIEGCYFNVVGLPLGLMAQMFLELGIDILEVCKKDEERKKFSCPSSTV